MRGNECDEVSTIQTQIGELADAVQPRLARLQARIERHEAAIKALERMRVKEAEVGWIGVINVSGVGDVVRNPIVEPLLAIPGICDRWPNSPVWYREGRFLMYECLPAGASSSKYPRQGEYVPGEERWGNWMDRGGDLYVCATFESKEDALEYATNRAAEFRRRTNRLQRILKRMDEFACPLCGKRFRMGEVQPKYLSEFAKVEHPLSDRFLVRDWWDKGARIGCLGGNHLKGESDIDSLPTQAVRASMDDIDNAYDRGKDGPDKTVIPRQIPLGEILIGGVPLVRYTLEYGYKLHRDQEMHFNRDDYPQAIVWRLEIEIDLPTDPAALEQAGRYVEATEVLERIANRDLQGLETVTLPL